jgi:dTDP-D-glucose 4,6-dehydratase
MLPADELISFLTYRREHDQRDAIDATKLVTKL